VIKNMAKVLGVSSDELIFDEKDGVASARILDSKLLEQFEALSRMKHHDKEAVMTIIDSMIMKNKIEEIVPPRSDAAWTAEMKKVISELRKGAGEYTEEEINRIVDEAVKEIRSEKRKEREKVEA
jgi:hypothetical protein